MTSKKLPNLLYISDNGYNGLCEQARSNFYTTTSNRGLTDYISAASKCKFNDTRPTYMISASLRNLEEGKWPIWTWGDVAKPRRPVLADEALRNLNAIAQRYGIKERQHDAPHAIASAVLEAIGLGLLTPINIPVGRWYSESPRQRHKYFQLNY